MDIKAAIFCAHVLTGYPLPEAHESLPLWLNRLPTEQEKSLSDEKNALGLFIVYKGIPISIIIANSWPILVHESVHYLQWVNDVPYKNLTKQKYQREAFVAQQKSNQCKKSLDTD